MIRARTSILSVSMILIVATVACTDRADESEQVADTTPAAATETTAAAGSTDTQTGFLDPNAATREQLAALPGMDSAAVNAVVSSRPYDNMLGVDRALANHLTETERDSVYTRLWKPLDLNSASGDEILLIPGVGPRMRREFLEYRPYNSIERFRREIGKYVDSAEVARLERYVTIR